MLRRIVVSLLSLAALALPVAPSEAVSSVAYTFVVDCANPYDTYSLVEMPVGTYAVTVAGACTIFGSSGPTSVPVTTCGIASVPCVDTGASINNVPSQACGAAYPGGYARACSPQVTGPGCGIGSVRVDNQCPSLGLAGTIYHGHPGAMAARFHDTIYYDNIGVLTITVVWTLS